MKRMGKYFNPPDTLPKVGRLLDNRDTFDGLVSQLRDGEKLIGCFDKFAYKCCPYINSEKVFRAFYGQYSDGAFVSARYYAVSKQDFDEYVR